jgi:uncharacterized membrane protein HdeD (DUF308 family)
MQSVTHSQFPLHPRPVLEALAGDWALLRAIVAIAFGVLALAWPSITLLALVLVFGGYALIDGLISLISAIFQEDRPAVSRWWIGAIGLFSVAAGFLTLLWPGLTTVSLLYLIGAWAITTGVAEIIVGITLRRDITDEWLLIVAGIVSVLLGVGLVLQPASGAVSLVWIIGTYAIIVGLLRLVVAMRVRRHGEAVRDSRNRSDFM